MQNETAPKISASIRKSLKTILIKWDPKSISGVKGEIIGYELMYKLVKLNGNPKVNSLWTTAMFSCYHSTAEFNLTDLLPFSQYEIKMAVFTAEGVGKYSEAVYGGRYSMLEQIRGGTHI